MNSTDNLETKQKKYGGIVINGFVALFLFFLILALPLIYLFNDIEAKEPLVFGISCFIACVIFFTGIGGFFVQDPNIARVISFAGVYKGTFYRNGFFWINPFMSKRKISLQIHNMDIQPIKVNDRMGNPVLIGMVMVWKINDTYRAVYDVNGGVGMLSNFVSIQGEAALREVTGTFAYDSSEDAQGMTLREGGAEINHILEDKINERLSMAGIRVVEARINYLAYAPEIAAVMLRRQQAAAIISARERIVEGAVSMVELALDRLDKKSIAKFDEKQRAALVSNLLVVLCADESAQPVINTGEK